MSARRIGAGITLVLVEQRVDAALWRNYVTGPSQDTRNALFERYKVVARKAGDDEYRRVGAVGIERTDCRQLAMEALLQAIGRFDPVRGSRFEGFLRRRVRGNVLNYLAKENERAAQYSYHRRVERDRLRSIKVQADADAKLGNDPVEQMASVTAHIALGFMLEAHIDSDQLEVADKEPSAYDTLAWRQLLGELDRRLTQLPEREAFILDKHYRQGVAFREIATLLGLSKGRISQLHAQALARLRRQMAQMK